MNETATSDLPQVGSRFGIYTIEKILGEGDVAKVYLTRGENGCCVALKVLKPEAAQYEEVRSGLDREYALTAHLSHPGVVGAIEGGEIYGHAYLTMPAIEGGSLDKRMLGGKRLPVDTAISIARQIASALQYIHAKGIVHRDVKPANILLDANNRARLCDFGLAVELASASANVDAEADLYSLGVVLYRMITGRAPFAAHVAAAPPRPSKFACISPALEALLLKALAKDPAERFQSGAEFAAALANRELYAQPARRFRLPRLLSWPVQMQAG